MRVRRTARGEQRRLIRCNVRYGVTKCSRFLARPAQSYGFSALKWLSSSVSVDTSWRRRLVALIPPSFNS